MILALELIGAARDAEALGRQEDAAALYAEAAPDFVYLRKVVSTSQLIYSKVIESLVAAYSEPREMGNHPLFSAMTKATSNGFPRYNPSGSR